jgi:cell division protein FtsW (lipid II flippase)
MSAPAAKSPFDVDWGLAGLVLLLLAIGIVMLTSASISVAENSTGHPFFYLIQQLTAVGAGALAAFFVLRTPTGTWERAAPLLLAGCSSDSGCGARSKRQYALAESRRSQHPGF